MSRNALLAKIHIAKKELCLDDDTYRGMLRNIFKVDSAKDLSDLQLSSAIKRFQGLGWKPKIRSQKSEVRGQKAGDRSQESEGRGQKAGDRSQESEGRGQKKYDDQKGDPYSATPAQKRMIEAMWHDIYRGNDEAKHLRQFLFRVAKVSDLRFLEKKNASDVVEAIKAISRRRYVKRGHWKDRKVERMWRKCLRCDKSFEANGLYNRVCPRCHHNTEYYERMGLGVLVEGNYEGGIYNC